MKIDAVALSTSNMEKTVQFYSILGFDFSQADPNEEHVEPVTPPGSARLMIDKQELMEKIIGEAPKPSNHSPFAIYYDSPKEVDQIATQVLEAGFKVIKEPWDAFWGQRYCIVEDPDGYKVDLFANLEK